MPFHTKAERAKNAKRSPKAKNFIKKAIKRPGGLRNSLRKKFDVKLPAGKDIPKSLITKARNLPKSAGNKLIKQQANLAVTLSKLRPKKKKK